MSGLAIQLLGHPAVSMNGEEIAPPRGSKAWGMLAFLASSPQQHPRPELAELLFGRAEDPLGALRWNLAALRRLLQLPESLKGDSITLELPVESTVDVRLVGARDPLSLIQPGFGLELLAGLSFPDSPEFEIWLLSERRRLARQSASLLRETALGQLARGAYDDATRYAAQLVRIDPLDEGHHALLIRAYSMSGDADGARRQFDRCREILRTELSVEPGTAVTAAVNTINLHRSTQIREHRSDEVASRLAVAWQSFLAGAIDHGIDLGRGAVWLADVCADEELRILTRVFLGAMMGLAVRGWDEAATVLNEALELAVRRDRPAEAALALGLIAGIDMMRADYDNVFRCVGEGLAMSEDPGARSVNLVALAAAEADMGRKDGALEHVRESVSAAEATADPVRVAYACSHAGRIHLIRKEIDDARGPIERAVSLTSGSLLALEPWPLAMLAEIEAASGNTPAAIQLANRAAALAATTGIAYQQAMAARVLGLAEAARGEPEAAVASMTEALGHARRTTGEGYTFHWPVAFILESLSETSLVFDPDSSRRWAGALLEHSSAIGMSEFVVRAHWLLSDLGAIPTAP